MVGHEDTCQNYPGRHEGRRSLVATPFPIFVFPTAFILLDLQMILIIGALLIMGAFEKVLLKEKPDLIIVVGDVNSTLACSLVSSKLNIKVAHVEAGLRSFDRTMPEELNRIVTDSLSDFLFVSEASGFKNLKREGINSNKVHFAGNVMIDTLLSNMDKINPISLTIFHSTLQPAAYNLRPMLF